MWVDALMRYDFCTKQDFITWSKYLQKRLILLHNNVAILSIVVFKSSISKHILLKSL